MSLHVHILCIVKQVQILAERTGGVSQLAASAMILFLYLGIVGGLEPIASSTRMTTGRSATYRDMRSDDVNMAYIYRSSVYLVSITQYIQQ